MPEPDRHVVRPRPWKLVLYLLGFLVFIAVSGFMIVTGNVLVVVVGLVGIAFFGGGLVMVVVFVARRGLSHLTLTRAGVRLRSGGTIPWADVEEVGVTKEPTTMVWLRLRDHDRYLASIPPDGARESGVTIGFLKPFAHLLRFIPAMRRYAKQVRDHADELVWNRQHFGFEVGISPAWLDRSPDRFVALLERYRASASD
jgi:hypothetical protein